MHGTTRQLINNMVVGVTEGFKKYLTILGVGYQAKMNGKRLQLQLGFLMILFLSSQKILK